MAFDPDYLRYCLRQIADSGDPDEILMHAVVGSVRLWVDQAGRPADPPPAIRVPRPYIRLRRGGRR